MKKILLVEDDLLFLKTLQLIFEQHGYETITAQDGKEGARLLEQGEFDMLITDLMLPYVSGLELLDKIRSSDVTSGIPVIVLSSVDNENYISESMAMGADDYVKKPIIPRDLLSRVDRLLKRQPSLV